jgi:hypothetical protein
LGASYFELAGGARRKAKVTRLKELRVGIEQL